MITKNNQKEKTTSGEGRNLVTSNSIGFTNCPIPVPVGRHLDLKGNAVSEGKYKDKYASMDS